MPRSLRHPPAWAVAAVAGVLCLPVLPGSAALDDVRRLAPVLGFLVAITALAGIADAAGVFRATATRCARLGRGRVPVLFALVVVLAVLTTVVLSLDTTAVLLTPVVLALTRELDLPPLPFALATVWLANTGSLLLPVSNLTNLLAEDRLGLDRGEYVSAMAAPAAVAVVVTTAVLVLLHGRSLRGRYRVPAAGRPADPVLFRVAAGAVGVFLVGVAAGLAVWAVAAVCALVTAAVSARRRPSVLRADLVPWRLLPLVTGLLLVVDTAGRHGLDRLLASLVDGAGPLGVAGAGAVLANLVDNLPAYLALERVVPVHALPGLLVGVDVGPVVLPWASLATLLWADRCRAGGVEVRWSRFALSGLLLAVVAVPACALTARA